jgi:hypothetical protein
MQTLVFPSAQDQDHIETLITKGIAPAIASLDLEMVKMKMREPEEKLGWTHEQVEAAEIEYKRYLTLCLRFPYPKHSVVPNKIMDTMWHYHIMDTKAYHKDCNTVFGHYLHHYPYFGLRGEEDAKNLKSAFEKTKEYYISEFREPMTRDAAGDCWHDCESRCWHACSGGGGGDDD